MITTRSEVDLPRYLIHYEIRIMMEHMSFCVILDVCYYNVV